MTKAKLMAFARPTEGREDEFNRWYDEVHVPDALSVPGMVRAERMKEITADGSARYIAIYDLEADDPEAVVAELRARVASGKFVMSDAMDMTNVGMGLYKEL